MITPIGIMYYVTGHKPGAFEQQTAENNMFSFQTARMQSSLMLRELCEQTANTIRYYQSEDKSPTAQKWL